MTSFVLNMVEEGFGTPLKPSLAVLKGYDMKFANEHEKSIYMSGFFAGQNRIKPKENYTKEELEYIQGILQTYCDGSIDAFSSGVDSFYKVPEWFLKLAFNKKLKARYEDALERDRQIIDFLSYVRRFVLPQYLRELTKEKIEK